MDGLQKKRCANALFVVTFAFWMSIYSFQSYVVPELERMGALASLTGLISGVYGFTQLCLRMPLGMCAGRLGRQKPFVVLGCAFSALACAGAFLFYTPAGFLFFRAACGFAASTWVSFTVLYGSYFQSGEAPRRITLLNLANQAGQLGGYFLAAALAVRLPVRSALPAGFVLALAAMAGALTLREASAPTGPVLRLRELAAAARNRYLLVCSLPAMLLYLIAQGTCQSFTATLATALGATASQLSALNIVMSATVVAGNLVTVQKLLPRFGARKLVAAGFGCAFFYCILAPLAGRLWVLFAAQPLIGAAYALVAAVLLGQCIRDIAPPLRSAAMGFFQALYGAGMALGPVLSGMLIDMAGIRFAYFALAGVAALGAASAMRLMR